MPILGTVEATPSQPLYFKSLQELDAWIPGNAGNRYDGIVRYKARRSDNKSENRGKLLVCHDYKGGYTESPFARAYTFNFWSTCDTFVYFSHQRVTIPPPGWISAAHRQGVKILGTLIFEGGGEEDCLRLLVGKMPVSKTGQVDQSTSSLTLPLSPYYARVLAELARERGFDGYLLNFECPLAGGLEQTRALAAWITLLQSEILSRVGPHGETLWYDSVIFTGQLRWQDRLNSLNLPFFLSSTGLFSNYTWHRDYPALTAQYFLSLDPTLTGNALGTPSQFAPKALQDIYMGVDVWGRGSHGGGGLGCYRAISHIAPESLGLSVALFGHAWTWESEQDKPGWTWDKWWEYESKFWVGPVVGTVDVPEAPQRKDEPECLHGPFLPIASFFPLHPPPEPSVLTFHTTFCPGTGLAWFVEGVKVFQSANGWTDVDKQTSVGDLVWPRPKLLWDDDRGDEIPTALTAFCMNDAWSGGSSLRLTISCHGSEDEMAAYRPLWLPIHSVSLTLRDTYEAHAIYKLDSNSADCCDTEFALAVKPLPGSLEDFDCDITGSATTELAGGWTKLTIQFTVARSATTSSVFQTAAIGLVIAIVTEEPTQPLQLSFLLGQLNIAPYLPQSFREEDSLVLWADYNPMATTNVRPAAPLLGALSWEVATSFPRVTAVNITSPDDPLSAWNLQPTVDWFPSFLYFNVYVQPFVDDWNVGKVEKAVWIGTSGSDGQRNGFDVVPENLPFSMTGKSKIRFYIQGVTDRGKVLKWDKCAFVDVSL
ncbi:glycoside hydrolase family 85 protein [Crassisporium funariophilum]|nr:glycoside hydrolase family 85 protein [Crassisporium funariophilum]